jgi:cytochrome c-type biogenesis protein CcmH/NrfF
VAHLESLVKCPSCEDLSVAQSNATTAVAVRHEIVADVAAGKSDNQILTSIEAAYGTSILLSPPTSGLGVLLWIVPLGVVLALIVVGLRLRRRWR